MNRVQDRRIDKVIHRLEPGYLGPFTRVADLPSIRSLRSVGTNRLVVPNEHTHLRASVLTFSRHCRRDINRFYITLIPILVLM